MTSLLQAKKSNLTEKRMQDAINEVSKGGEAIFFARLPSELKHRLEINLTKRKIIKKKWFNDMVKKYLETD